MPTAANGFLLALLALAPAAPAQTPRERPNVLFVAVDDLNDWVGVLGGHPQARTPNLDALAARGVLFANAHSSATTCAASRASLLTGVGPSTSGVYTNAHDWRECERLAGAVTLPLHFRQQGYRTLGAGKIFHAHSFREWAFSGHCQPAAWHDYFPSLTRQMPDEYKPAGWPIHTNPTMYDGHFDWAPVAIADDEMADGRW